MAVKANRVLDFDKFMAEKNNDVIEVKLYGKKYKVQASIPAIVPVMMSRSEVAADAMARTKMLMRAGDAMLGPDNIIELCNKGMSAENLAKLINELFLMINGSGEDDDQEEEISDESSRKPTGTGKSKGKG